MDLKDIASSTDNVDLWVEGWMNDSSRGNLIGVRRIMETAEKIKEVYCTDGLWTLAIPAKDSYDALIRYAGIASYDALIRYAGIAQKQFEKCLRVPKPHIGTHEQILSAFWRDK